MKKFKSLIIVVVLMAVVSVSFAGHPPPLEPKINYVEKEKSLVDQFKTTETLVIEKKIAPVDVGFISYENNADYLLYVKTDQTVDLSTPNVYAKNLSEFKKTNFSLQRRRLNNHFHKHRYNKTEQKKKAIPPDSSGTSC